MKCLACGTETDRGRVVAGELRTACGPCDKAWLKSGERKRYVKQGASASRTALSRAFTDWLTRVRAERRNSETGRGARTA